MMRLNPSSVARVSPIFRPARRSRPPASPSPSRENLCFSFSQVFPSYLPPYGGVIYPLLCVILVSLPLAALVFEEVTAAILRLSIPLPPSYRCREAALSVLCDFERVTWGQLLSDLCRLGNFRSFERVMDMLLPPPVR